MSLLSAKVEKKAEGVENPAPLKRKREEHGERPQHWKTSRMVRGDASVSPRGRPAASPQKYLLRS